ncbi:MAG: hypothetical protein ACO3C1_00710 [Ilumatobacteraceae bacterium]
MRRRQHVMWWVAAAATFGVGLAVALTPVEKGDSYCGTALYDTVLGGQCASPLVWRRAVGLALGVGAAGVVTVCGLSGVGRRERPARVGAVVLVVLSVVSAVVVVNRVLQPVPSAWCGSVVNRHRTYEPALEHTCDELLAPYRSAAAWAAAVAAASLVMGVALWRHPVADPARSGRLRRRGQQSLRSRSGAPRGREQVDGQ